MGEGGKYDADLKQLPNNRTRIGTPDMAAFEKDINLTRILRNGALGAGTQLRLL